MQQKNSLSLSEAKEIAEAAQAAAAAQGFAVSIAVTDQSAYLQHLVRMDGAGLLTADAATAKARSAAGTGFPTAYWSQVIRDGELSVLTIPGISHQAGGVPIMVNGQCVGAVGVSGGPPPVDQAIAEAGAAAIGGSAAGAP